MYQEKRLREQGRLIITLIVSFVLLISCKSISSSTSSASANSDAFDLFPDKLWVVVDENEFKSFQKENKYPENTVAVYYEDTNTSFYVMSSMARSKTLKQAEIFCKNMTKYGGNIRLPTEEDVNFQKKFSVMVSSFSRSKGNSVEGWGPHTVTSSKFSGEACHEREGSAYGGSYDEIWISKIRREDDYYDAYSVHCQSKIISNIPSNDRCPSVVCISDEHLKGIAKIPYKTWISYWDGVKKEQEANAKSYCEHNPNDDLCCDETTMEQGLLHERFEFDENNKVIRCTRSRSNADI